VFSLREVVVERSEWPSFFDRLSDDMQGQHVAVEVLDPELGDQVEVEKIPFAFSAYDPREDTVIISMGGTTEQYPVVLRHMINHPTSVDMTRSGKETVVSVASAADGTSLVHFTPPPALPPAP
jgi:hypothetical protein